MKYIVCNKPGQFYQGDKPQPITKKGEALVRILKVGICGTDLHAFQGNQAYFSYPRILGHELAGEILKIGENAQNLKVGDKVSVIPYMSCGKCIACRNGKSNCCIDIEVLGVHKDGGMQEIIAVPNEFLIRVNDLSSDAIALIEPLAIGMHAIRRANIQAGETILVMGCGPIGIGIMKFAQIYGAKVMALDINPDRLEFAKQEIGVDFILEAGASAFAKIKDYTQGDLATAVFDATGNQTALMAGPEYMSHGGRFILVGLSKAELSYSHPAIHAKETTIMCSRNASRSDFLDVIEVLKTGQFPIASYITHKVGMEEMIPHFDKWLDPRSKVIKAVVSWD